MLSTIVGLVMLAVIVVLGTAIVIAHRKQADAWATLLGFSGVLLTWLTFFKGKDDGNAGKGTQ